jgi:hypothetical protein
MQYNTHNSCSIPSPTCTTKMRNENIYEFKDRVPYLLSMSKVIPCLPQIYFIQPSAIYCNGQSVQRHGEVPRLTGANGVRFQRPKMHGRLTCLGLGQAEMPMGVWHPRRELQKVHAM